MLRKRYIYEDRGYRRTLIELRVLVDELSEFIPSLGPYRGGKTKDLYEIPLRLRYSRALSVIQRKHGGDAVRIMVYEALKEKLEDIMETIRSRYPWISTWWVDSETRSFKPALYLASRDGLEYEVKKQLLDWENKVEPLDSSEKEQVDEACDRVEERLRDLTEIESVVIKEVTLRINDNDEFWWEYWEKFAAREGLS